MSIIPNYSSSRLLISSGDRSYGSIEDFTYLLELSPFKDVVGFSVLSVSIPKSYLVVNQFTNSFQFEESLSGFHTGFIAQGNYNTTNFAAALASAINSAGGANVYSVTYSTITGLLTITRTLGVEDFRITGGTSLSITGSFPGNFATSQVASAPLSLNGPLELYIRSNALTNSTVQGDTSVENHSNSNIIMRVPTSIYNTESVFGYNVINFSPSILNIQRLSNPNLTKIDLAITLPSRFLSDKIDLRGENWSIEIMIYSSKYE